VLCRQADPSPVRPQTQDADSLAVKLTLDRRMVTRLITSKGCQGSYKGTNSSSGKELPHDSHA
jgi:hypothetical protein